MTMIVHHRESNTVFCDAHFQVVDAQGRCPACEAPVAPEPPTPSPWVDFHCVQRWQQRVEPAAEQVDAIASVRRVVMEGRRLTGPPRKPGCAYYVHPGWPGAVVVLKESTNAAITVLTV